MSSTMDKLKDKLHIRRKSQSEPDSLAEAAEQHGESRKSIDSELEAMSPEEREAYLKEWDEAEKTDTAKKNGLIEKLIARGNKRTEDQLRARGLSSGAGNHGHVTGAGGPGMDVAGASAPGDTVIR